MEIKTMSRLDLKALGGFDSAQTKEQLDEYFEIIIPEIYKKVISSAKNGHTRFVYNQSHGFRTHYTIMKKIQVMKGEIVQYERYEPIGYIPVVSELIKRLSTIFPDSNITTDDITSYILIEWS